MFVSEIWLCVRVRCLVCMFIDWFDYVFFVRKTSFSVRLVLGDWVLSVDVLCQRWWKLYVQVRWLQSVYDVTRPRIILFFNSKFVTTVPNFSPMWLIFPYEKSFFKFGTYYQFRKIWAPLPPNSRAPLTDAYINGAKIKPKIILDHSLDRWIRLKH